MADDEENDPTASFNELEAFDSIFSCINMDTDQATSAGLCEKNSS